MLEFSPATPIRQFVMLDTLVRLRWLAMFGQAIAVVIVSEALDFDVPVAACFAVLAFSGIVNLALQLHFPRTKHLSARAAALLLALHITELAILLYLTGGLQNPFTFFFLAPVMISATVLPPRLTLLLGLFAIGCASIIGFAHLPLPWHAHEPLALPHIYVIADLIALTLAIGVTALYAFQATEQARKLSEALSAAELVMAREQHLAQLDGLAAAAAHELGTPLATITVIAGELERALNTNDALASDVRMLREQTTRCRDILAKLTQLSTTGGMFDELRLSSLLEDIIAPHRYFDIALQTEIHHDDDSDEPLGTRDPAILYGLGNIIENAMDFAHSSVTLRARWSKDDVEIIIGDDGPGFAPDILRRIGEPYVSSRKSRHSTPAAQEGGRAGDGVKSGMGLGVFIAKTLLERTGARVAFTNRTFPAHGALVSVRWPRARFEQRLPDRIQAL